MEAASWEKFDDATAGEVVDEIEEYNDSNDDGRETPGYKQFTILRPLGSFDALLRSDFSSRRVPIGRVSTSNRPAMSLMLLASLSTQGLKKPRH
jgi:hypothetical protein